MTTLAAVVAFAFAALVTRLWFLQVLAAEEFRTAADSNRVRLVPLLAPRGSILDRGGELLVTNRERRTITIDRQEITDEQEAEVLKRLAERLDVPVSLLERNLEDPNYLPYQPIPVYEDAPKKVVFYIVEHPQEFPGVNYAKTPVRHYVHGSLAAHLVGYLGQISPAELEDPSFSDHLPGQRVGRGGVEQYYESSLHGENGWLKLEVNAEGRTLGDLGRNEPTPGNELWLSLDWETQDLAQETLRQAIGAARTQVVDASGFYAQAPAGAVVVLDPNNGHVLAMASFPTYDPRVFLGGISRREYRQLNKPAANYPLSNRAIAGLYPPGSTFKPFVASAALKSGYANFGSTYPCPPTFTWGGTVFNNWTSAHLGNLSLAGSLVRSCDTIYYNFGLAFWQAQQTRGPFFQQHLRRWGFSRDTGIDIPGEQDGRVPDPAWKQQIHEELPHIFPFGQWLPGDDINMSIGQGDLLVTPLQLAMAYGAIANGGTLYRPQVGMKIVSPDGDLVKRIPKRVIGRVPASPQALDFLLQSLTGVVQGEGTAAGAFAGFPLDRYPVAGKTGTSEVIIDGRDANHSWFAAIAPADDPQYVVMAMVEQGGHGSEVAAPIVRRVLEGLFGLEPGELQISSQAVD
ncbi:MAG: penicillin-binding protein 2 [Actinomycetota bacterium]